MNYRKKAILMVMVLFCLNITMLAQAVSVKIRNVSVKEAMTQLKDKSGYSFVYKVGDIDTKKIVTVEAKQLKDAINQILSGQNVVYEVKGKNIIVQKSQAQQNGAKEGKKRKITGVVKDNNGNPIIGATVREQGTTNGTITDMDANFSLDISPESVLEISYIGYREQAITIGSRTSINITLEEDQKLLDEVVVVGYGTTSRKNLTTSIATVKTENISKAANNNVSQMLLGRAAGLQASIASPQPGGSVNISIRGGGTPIYVVDGVVMPDNSLEVGSGSTLLPSSVNRSGLNGLNPSDIESVEILKDASAAIYGIGAADGVILITTKKGAEGKPRITYDGSYSIQKSYPYLEVLDAQEYMNTINIFSKENYLYNNRQYPYGDTPYDGKWGEIFSTEQIRDAKTTDWLDNVLRTGSVCNQNLTISGGSKSFKYYLGLNYYKEDGIVENSGMRRYSLRTNISSQLTKFLKLGTIVNINQNNFDNSTIGPDVGNKGNVAAGSLFTALCYPTYLPVYDKDGKYTIFKDIPNPKSLTEISDKSNQNGYFVNFTADVDIIKGMLSAKFLYGINQENSQRSAYIPSDLYFVRMYKSRGHVGNSKRERQTLEGTIAFQHQFGNWLGVNAVAGMGRYLEKYEGYDLSYENTNDKINDSNIAAAQGPFYPSSYKGEKEKRSQFVRASFDVFDKYVVAATLRRDGTDKFFPNQKYALFPSVSLAWKISNESFLKKVSWVNLLKVRASYGETGSDNLGSSLYGVITTPREDVKFNGNKVTYVPYILSGANYPDVTWQKTIMKNIGLDFSIFKDRLWGSLDFFRNDVTNLLGYASTSLLDMNASKPINGAHYKRVGVDFSLNSLNVKTSQFKWTTMVTLSHYNAIWLERMPNYDYNKYQQRENEPMSAYYYYKSTGIINEDRSNMPESQKSLAEGAQMPGYPIVEDRNGDGVIDKEDIYMDNNIPKVYFGFGNTFTYKDFDLDIFTYGQLGVKKYNYAYDFSSSAVKLSMGSSSENAGIYALRIWNSQTNKNGTMPGIAYGKTVALPENASLDINRQNASFLRIRNITLGYNLNAQKMPFFKGAVQSIRLYVDLQNPFTFTKYSGYDPEIITGHGSLAGQGGEYPQMRVYSFGAKLVF